MQDAPPKGGAFRIALQGLPFEKISRLRAGTVLFRRKAASCQGAGDLSLSAFLLS